MVRSKKENIHVENEDNRRTSRIEGEEDEEIKEGGAGKGGRKSFLEGERKEEEERRARHT